MMRLMVRGYSGAALIFQEKVEIERHEWSRWGQAQVERMLLYPKFMIEIEFLDEADVKQRFFRFGSDPRRMVKPKWVKEDQQ